MKKAVLLAFVMLISWSARAQKFDWVQEFSEGQYTAMTPAGGGHLYLTGTRILASRLNENGDTVWIKPFPKAYLYGRSIAPDGKGNVYVAGSFNGTNVIGDTTLKATIGEAFLAKMDSTGRLLWIRQSNSYNAMVRKLLVDKAGNIWVAGTFTNASFKFGGMSATGQGSDDVFFARFNAQGNAEYLGTIGGKSAEGFSDMEWLSAQQIVFTANYSNSASFGNLPLPNTGKRTSMLAILNTANLDLDNVVTDTGAAYNRLAVGKNVVYADLVIRGKTTIAGQDYTPRAQVDMLVIKMNNALQAIWATQVTNQYGAADLAVDSQGTVYIGGQFFAPGISLGKDHTFTNMGESDMFLAALDAKGNWLWAESASGSFIDECLALALEPDGSGYVLGSVQMGPAYLNNLKIKGDFSGLPYLARMQKTSVGIRTTSQKTPLCEIFPNPSNGLINIRLPYPQESTLVSAFNLQGQLIFTEVLQHGATIDVSSLPAGMYSLRVQQKSGTSFSRLQVVH